MTDTTKPPAAPPVVTAAACTIRAGYGNEITFTFANPADALRLRALREQGATFEMVLIEKGAKPA